MFIGGVPGEVLPILTLMDPSAKWTRETPRLMISAMSVERRQQTDRQNKTCVTKEVSHHDESRSQPKRRKKYFLFYYLLVYIKIAIHA